MSAARHLSRLLDASEGESSTCVTPALCTAASAHHVRTTILKGAAGGDEA